MPGLIQVLPFVPGLQTAGQRRYNSKKLTLEFLKKARDQHLGKEKTLPAKAMFFKQKPTVPVD